MAKAPRKRRPPKYLVQNMSLLNKLLISWILNNFNLLFKLINAINWLFSWYLTLIYILYSFIFFVIYSSPIFYIFYSSYCTLSQNLKNLSIEFFKNINIHIITLCINYDVEIGVIIIGFWDLEGCWNLIWKFRECLQK